MYGISDLTQHMSFGANQTDQLLVCCTSKNYNFFTVRIVS